jgi:hypothetical protein
MISISDFNWIYSWLGFMTVFTSLNKPSAAVANEESRGRSFSKLDVQAEYG